MSTLVLALGNQLFSVSELKARLRSEKNFLVFMREDQELCTYFRFHQQKIVFFLSAMRNYRDELKAAGCQVHYEELEITSAPHARYELKLLEQISKKKITKICFFEIEDKFFEKRILDMLAKTKVEIEIWQSPMFFTSRPEFKTYLKKSKKPFTKVFYEQQRKKLQILLDQDQQPMGGKWSFDAENRLRLPETIQPPEIKLTLPTSPELNQVKKLVQENFNTHPGSVDHFWLPTTRDEAIRWLDLFLKERLKDFGPYEDAIPSHSNFVFHSVLTPFLNTGLLTPSVVVERTLRIAKIKNLPLASLEGFIRQIIGWREFIRGIYQNYSEQQDSLNFFNHRRSLTHHWYEGTTGIRPLDHAIQKAIQFGYTHHIERLMVIGSLMLLLEVKPTEAHRWFMEMYIDSSDWVMGPNVYGMALFSDGGIFATKPYFCGSNYYRKMGPYQANEDWCDGVDGLYWGFIEKNKSFFQKNPRMSMMVKTVEKMDPEKKRRIYQAAKILKEKITTSV